MWKLLVFGVLVTYGAVKLISPKNEVSVPTFPKDQYWGPREPKKLDTSIRPFKIDVSKEIIDDLKVRLSKTRTLRKPLEGVGWTYGIDTDYLETILEYWRTKYDWEKRQALLNKFPHFKTYIQGLDIHYQHVKPTVPKDGSIKVFPLLLVHGWPGSIVEFQKIIPLLTTPRPGQNFVFEVIAPSLPGYGFSDAAVRPGLAPPQMAVIMKNLMDRLGFEKFYTQGGDWGSFITSSMAVLYPESILGTHLNMCGNMSPKATFWAIVGAYIPSLVIDEEHWSKMYPLSHHWSRLVEESGYVHLQATKPDTVGTALSDSPAGLAAYILEKFSTWTNPENRFSQDGKLLEKFSLDELLDNLMVYWVTNSITTSQRLYAEAFSSNARASKMDSFPLTTPVSCAVFPHEISYQAESLLRDRYRNLIHLTHMPRGGHFGAFEEPELLADNVWTFVNLVEQSSTVKKKTKKTDL